MFAYSVVSSSGFHLFHPFSVAMQRMSFKVSYSFHGAKNRVYTVAHENGDISTISLCKPVDPAQLKGNGTILSKFLDRNIVIQNGEHFISFSEFTPIYQDSSHRLLFYSTNN